MDKAKAGDIIIIEMIDRLPFVPYTATDGGMRQYNELRAERPELFEFPYDGDKWQFVQALLKNRKVIT